MGALPSQPWILVGAGLVAAILIYFSFFTKAAKSRRRRRALAAATTDYQTKVQDIRRRFGAR